MTRKVSKPASAKWVLSLENYLDACKLEVIV
jgi:hypothetical protein